MSKTIPNDYGHDWTEGCVIEFCGESYRILKNFGDSGSVEYLDGTFASNNFYWVFQGVPCLLVSKPE